MEFQGQRFIFDEKQFLGHGGMGWVTEGVRRDDPSIHVAIKVPLPGSAPNQIAHFLREAEAAQRVSGPHIVPVIDWGTTPPFLAFAFVTGPTLEDWLEDRAKKSGTGVDVARWVTTAQKGVGQ